MVVWYQVFSNVALLCGGSTRCRVAAPTVFAASEAHGPIGVVSITLNGSMLGKMLARCLDSETIGGLQD